MDRIDDDARRVLRGPTRRPRLSERLLGACRARPANLEKLADRFRIDATERGVARLYPGRGDHGASARRAHAERARQELGEYLAGRRTFFTVAVDLAGVGDVPGARARRGDPHPVRRGRRRTRRSRDASGHPRAARAVGNALGANPVPVIVPCHRIVRGDGTWGHYAFGGAMKTQLLRLERTTAGARSAARARGSFAGAAAPTSSEWARPIALSSRRSADAASVGYRPCRVCRPPAAA